MGILQIALIGCSFAAGGPPDPPNDTFEIESLTELTKEGENTKPFVIARHGSGVYVAWAQRRDQSTAVYFTRSTDGDHFDPPTRLTRNNMDLDLGAENGPNAAVAPDGTIYVVWAGGVLPASKSPSDRANSTAATAAPSAERSGHTGHGRTGAMHARPDNLNIYLSRSTDDGRTFSEPIKVNDDRDGPEHRFPTVATDELGRVYVSWLDKRKSSESRPNLCRVYCTMSSDNGKSFARNVDATAGQEGPICHCCRVALAVHAIKGVFVAFRNDVNDLRDMFLVHSTDGATAFSKPTAMEETGWYVPT